MLLDEQFKDVPKSTHVIFDVPFIDVRLINFEPLTAFKYLKASSYGEILIFSVGSNFLIFCYYNQVYKFFLGIIVSNFTFLFCSNIIFPKKIVIIFR